MGERGESSEPGKSKELHELLAGELKSKVLGIIKRKLVRLGAKEDVDSLAEDVFQEVLLAAYKSFGKNNNTFNLETVLGLAATIAERKSIDYFKRFYRRGTNKKVPVVDVDYADVNLASGAPEDLDVYDEQFIREAAAKLPRRQREAIDLVFIQKKSYKEAADALGIGVNGLRARLEKARLLLADISAAEERDEETKAARKTVTVAAPTEKKVPAPPAEPIVAEEFIKIGKGEQLDKTIGFRKIIAESLAAIPAKRLKIKLNRGGKISVVYCVPTEFDPKTGDLTIDTEVVDEEPKVFNLKDLFSIEIAG